MKSIFLTSLVLAFLVVIVGAGQSFAIEPKSDYSETMRTWTADDGSTKSLVREYLDKKARRWFLKTCEGTKCSWRLLKLENASLRGDENFFFHVNPNDGFFYRVPITQSARWPDDESFELAPDEIVDPDRKLLKLVSFEGVPFFDFYYLPKGYEQKKPLKLAVIFKGGEQPFLASPDHSCFLERPTIDALREQGYAVLLANWRGKANINWMFRLSGPGHVFDRGLRDLMTALDTLAKVHQFDSKNLLLIGHSQGAHFAALAATRLGELTQKYRIRHSILSSPTTLNMIDSYYGYYQGMSLDREDVLVEDKPLNFVEDDWTHGALCFRPPRKLTDAEWTSVQAAEKEHFGRMFSKIVQNSGSFCKTQVYFDQSPYHHHSGLQGTMDVFAGEEEQRGATLDALQFQDKVGFERVRVHTHPYGHGFWQADSQQYWLLQLKNLLEERNL